MSADDVQRRVTLEGPHVTIEVVDADTAALARAYFESMVVPEPSAADELADLTGRDRSEFDAGDTAVPDFDEQAVETADESDNTSEDTNDDATEDDQDGAADVESTDGPADVPIDGREWEQPEYRDARVQAFIEAMHDHYEEPFETTASAVAEQTGDAAKGVVWSLKDLDGFAVEKAGETDEGATVWRIAPVEADEPTDASSVSDDPADDDADSDNSEPEESDDDPEPDERGDEIPQNHPTIEVEDRTKTRTLDANDVVDALQKPTKHRAKAQLGLSLDGFERLLAQLDLTERFEADAPLPAGEVQETVATYLEVDA